MKILYLALAFSFILFGCKTNETGQNKTTGGDCNYNSTTTNIMVDSIVPVNTLGYKDTTECSDCRLIYYHTAPGEKLSGSCFSQSSGGDNVLMDGEKYFDQAFIEQNEIAAGGAYVVKVEEIVSGTCTPCIISFIKK
jgi:hypothetical protein